MGHRVPETYTHALNRGLRGVRLAYDRRYVDGPFGPGDDEQLAILDAAIAELRAHGAIVTDVTSRDPFAVDEFGRVPFDDEFTVLLYEFKVQVAEYLATLGGTNMRTLTDLIQFNLDRCDEELVWFGQEVFEAADTTSGDLTDPEYLAAHRSNRAFGRGAIDEVLAQGFDAVLMPTFSFGTGPAATGGYPSMAVPVGYTSAGRPVGFWLAASFLQEATLIRAAHGIEQAIGGRVAPTLAGSVPPDPTPFPGCPATTATTARTSSLNRAAAPTAPVARSTATPRNW
jgi:amidase